MSTTVAARPVQTLRRRETTRPTLATKRGASVDLGADSASKKRKLDEPYVWTTEYILKKHRGKRPSLIIHLHTTHFRFEGSDASWTYDSSMRLVIEHLKRQTVPHELLDYLHNENVAFYDGCLIVEVHNHREIEKKKNGAQAEKTEDTKKLSIHNWNAHITPSPYVPFPSDAQLDADDAGSEDAQGEEDTEKPKAAAREAHKITTLVLHPTAQCMHEELYILANTPADVLRKKMKDSSTPQSAVPPTPTTGSRGSVPQRAGLTQQELYEIQGQMLVATQPPLYLEPARDADEANAILDMLRHPLHNEPPPTLKSRKRTTAEMAADDAQAAAIERRMLIYDERLGPLASGTNTADNQGSSALGFSRFKTIAMVRQKLEEAERLKKEAEARDAVEKRQEEQLQSQKLAAAQQKKQQEANQTELRRRQLLQQQAQQQEMLKLNTAQQAGMHAHGLQNLPNGQNFQVNGSQASPVVNQQTPLMPHSSPMLGQNGFMAMQNAGSPPRPPSAAMNGVGMARGASQHAHTSHNNTPHMMQGGTPLLANAVPNRQMSQTPHLNPSSPMTGTPVANVMQTPRLNGSLNPTQELMMLQAQNGLQNGEHGAVPLQSITLARQMAQCGEACKQYQAQHNNAVNQGQAAEAQHYAQRFREAKTQWNSMYNELMASRAGSSPAQPHQTPANTHAHPNSQQDQSFNQAQQTQQAISMARNQQQARSMQQEQQRRQAAMLNQQLQHLARANGGTISPQQVESMPPQLKQFYFRRVSAARAQQMQQQQQNMQMNGQQSPGAANYVQDLQNLGMQTLRQSQQTANLARAMANNLDPSNMQGLAAQHQQRMQAQQIRQRQQQQQQQQQNGGDLSQSFAAMHNALSRGQGQQ